MPHNIACTLYPGVLLAICLMPQIWKMIQTRSARDLSYGWTAFYFVGMWDYTTWFVPVNSLYPPVCVALDPPPHAPHTLIRPDLLLCLLVSHWCTRGLDWYVVVDIVVLSMLCYYCWTDDTTFWSTNNTIPTLAHNPTTLPGILVEAVLVVVLVAGKFYLENIYIKRHPEMQARVAHGGKPKEAINTEEDVTVKPVDDMEQQAVALTPHPGAPAPEDPTGVTRLPHHHLQRPSAHAD